MKIVKLIGLVCIIFFVASCASVDVERIDASTQTDLSGYWNDTDVRLIAESLVQECVASLAITNYIQTYNDLPVVIVGSFLNQSDEHIDTSILAQKFEVALVNSGRVIFVASADQREELRDERTEQQEWASEETASRLANETGADFMLVGTVKTIVDAVDNISTRTYYITAELIAIETNRKLWIGENSEIKKYITRSTTRL